jgi:pimeloyl-ACP methyl ester carboxylesterase
VTIALALKIAVSVTVWVALLGFAAFLAGRWFFVERHPDEVHYAVTEDGWRIAVTRYRATRPLPGRPVVLLHGLAANRLHLDLTDETSLARYLAQAGRDTWLVELRGRGLSTRPRLFSKFDYDWSFDEYVQKDLPVALAEVRRATGSAAVDLVGVSLGGMIVYALLGHPELSGPVGSAVTIGAPATFKFQGRYLAAWPLRNLRFLRHRFLMRLLAPLAGYWHPSGMRLMHHPDNLPGDTLRRFMTNAAANFGRNELLQFGDWIANDAFRSIDQKRDYRGHMRDVGVPTLCVAGNKDRIAPPNTVKDAYELLGSRDKKLVIASHGQGFDGNYGHLDLVIGPNAAKEVFPLVREWLEAHSATETRTKAGGEARSASS